MKITVKAFTVARSQEEAAALVSGATTGHVRPWESTLSTIGAARLYMSDINRIKDNRRHFIFPVTVTFDVPKEPIAHKKPAAKKGQ